MTAMTLRTILMVSLLPIAAAAVAQTAPPPPGTDGQAAGPMTLAQFQAEQAQRMMAADTDHDGRVSEAEWAAQREARGGPGGHGGGSRFGGSGGGGSGSGGHFGGGGGGGGGGYDPARAFARIDTNGDGFLDKAEIDEASAERFRRMDANGDGVVTPDERMASRGGMHRHGEHGNDGAPTGGQPTPPPSTPQ